MSKTCPKHREAAREVSDPESGAAKAVLKKGVVEQYFNLASIFSQFSLENKT